jgi:hypothetical protein
MFSGLPLLRYRTLEVSSRQYANSDYLTCIAVTLWSKDLFGLPKPSSADDDSTVALQCEAAVDLEAKQIRRVWRGAGWRDRNVQ